MKVEPSSGPGTNPGGAQEQGPTAARRVELAATLKQEARLGEEAAVTVVDRVIEVRRRDAHVLLVFSEDLEQEPLRPWLEELAQGRTGLLVIGTWPKGLLKRLPERVVAGTAPDSASIDELFVDLEGLLERVEIRRQHERRGRWLQRYRYELGELIDIARAMTRERDIDRLLDLILERSRFITGADAGSIYVVEGPATDPEERVLRFKLSQNESCQFESSEFTMPVSTRSIAGYAVVTRKPINIPDVYEIPSDAPYGFDATFDQRVGYRTRSMLAVPMISAEDEVIGVIQLLNRKRDAASILDTHSGFEDEVVPFDERCEDLLQTLATQAGIALENALLYDEIKRIFEGFVHASVEAIEQRDPTTSGHSWRVSLLSCKLAEIVDRVDAGGYAATSFTRRQIKELEYAALLHDFGKIGVREEVLVKAKKLYPHQLTAVRERIHYALKRAEAEALARKLDVIGKGGGESDLARFDEELAARRAQLEDAWRVISEANEPTVLSEGEFTRIAEVGAVTFVDGTGAERTLLDPEEVRSLQVTRGSLNEREIDEIRSHVVHTFNFLAKIPWGKSFTDIPRIAGAHHEKLDGSGYPANLTAEQIPVQSKIMTIADIYDALTARDRPYKKAVPVQRALDILGFEVKGGKLDPELVQIFQEARVYETVEEAFEDPKV